MQGDAHGKGKELTSGEIEGGAAQSDLGKMVRRRSGTLGQREVEYLEEAVK